MNQLLLFLLLLFSAQNLYSCDCEMYPVEKYIDTSQFIIRVKVESVITTPFTKKLGTGYDATVRIQETLKGSFKKGDYLTLNNDSTGCSFRFKMGDEYLLFIYKSNQKYYVSPCSHSDLVSESRKNIRKIRKYIRLVSCEKFGHVQNVSLPLNKT